MPGVGEVGSNAGALQLYGPHYWLTRGWDGGVQLGNGKHYPILISIQQPVENSRPWALKPVIDGIMNRYKIKRNALHFTAISQGCWVLNQFITYMPNSNDYSYVKLVKSMVNVQGMNPADTYGATLPFAEKMGHWAARFGGRELGFEQVNDTRNINRIVSNMNDSINGSGKIIWTAFGGGGHSNFNDFYDPGQTNWTLSNANVRAKKGSVETLPIEGGQNIWQWMLRQGDTLLAGEGANPPPPLPGIAPVANAGGNKSITLPASSVTLDGSSSSDAGGSIVSYNWTKISGPLSFSILNLLQPITLVNSLVQGEYRFELKVINSQGLIGKDTVTVTVNAAPNAVPVAHAGNDVQLTLPFNTTTLIGSGTDADDLLLTYKWTKVSGPGQFNILTPTLPVTVINNLVAGIYQFELAVTDGKNATGKDTVTITVVSPVNNPPVAFAGSDVQITLPINLVTLAGSATDADDILLSYKWNKVSGPTQFSMLTPTLPVTVVSGLVQGVYEFELVVTDSKNASGKDTVRVTVNPAPAAGCIAKAGADQVIPRSQGFAVLDGSASVGTTFKWRRLTTVDFDFKANVKRSDSAKADVLILPYRVGGYDFELVATSFGCISKDTVNIKVDYGQAPPQSTDGPAGWHYATAADVSSIPTARIGDVIINGARSNVIETGEFSSVYIYPTSPINIGPGKKVLIKGGKYSSVVLNFGEGQVVGSSQNPVIITNYGGQVETQMMTVTNAVNAKITGKYVAGVSGDVNFKGHAEGKYAFSRGTYGIYCNNNWSSLASVGLKINGEKTDSLEIEYVEIGNGNFAGVQIKQDAGTNDYDGFHIHDIYIHDIHGEGMYLGSTSSGQRHKLNGWLLQNIRIVNSGNELFQMGNIGANTRIRNNVFINSATNWKSPFNLYQDNGIQLSFNNGNCEFRNNIVLGAGTQTFNGYSGLRPDLPYNGDSIYINNNLMKYSRGFIGGYWGSGSVPINGLVVKIDSNYFGGFQFAGNEVYNNTYAVNTNTLLRTVTNGTRYVVRNTISDGSKSLAVTGGNIDTSGTIVRNINNPQFVNSGWPADFNWNKLYEWSDFIFATWGDENVTTTANVKWKTPVYFKQGDLVLFLSKVYKSKINGNHGHMPHGVTDEYWELQTWNDGGIQRHFPADDYRLVDGDEYKQRNIGLTTSAVPPANQLPVVNAGSDITITLPVSSATLVGTASDPDGNIAASAWTKIAGPTSYTIQAPAQLQTGLTNLTEGVYRFVLTVTDNRGGVAKDTVQVTVKAAVVTNQPPIAITGPDKVITLPVNTVTLNGSGTDPENSAITYRWYYLSGPAQHTITSPNQAVTVINNLTQGVYKFVLEVKDVQGLTGRDTVSVTVNAPMPSNQLPVAYSGGNLSITLPINTVTVNGTQSYDPDGSIQSYRWTKVAGPAQFNIVSATQVQTAINNLVQGVYRFELQVTDNSGATAKDTMTVTVNAAPVPNQAPISIAGANQTIVLPLNTVTLNGNGSYDPDGSIATYKWSKIAGPSGFTIVSPSQAQTVINNLVQGAYQFELEVTDNKGLTGKDTVIVTVNAAPPANQPPVAIAGDDRVITLPANSLTVSGASSYDPDGSIATYKWNKIAGPSGFTIVSPSQAQTVINNLVQGAYQFELVVTDNKGLTGKDTVIVTVNAAPPGNQLPVAIAGDDRVITLPANSLTVSGASSYDPDGSIAAYLWTKISGPAAFTIAAQTQEQTAITNLVQGTYQFELRVTDNKGAIAKDTLTITVNPQAANQLPVANAGNDVTITLPTNSLTLNGSSSYDPDGTITGYQWTRIAGPAQFTIATPTQKQTLVSNLVQGIYTFELTVTDNRGGTAKDVITVIVDAGVVNQLPVAKAGGSMVITLPVNSITANGANSYDPDGTITSYTWTKIAGPSQFNVASPTRAQTVINNLVQGIYKFELTVIDNKGAVAKDTLVVTVNPSEPVPNQLPVADAGESKTITFPVSSVVLDGSKSYDPDGIILTYQWSMVSGPSRAAIVASTAQKAEATELVPGEYRFKLVVTDNRGGQDDTTIIVNVMPMESTARVFPNPARNMINVVIESSTQRNNTYLRIFDAYGKMVYQEQFVRTSQKMTHPVDITTLAKGSYFVNI
ncbi:MAG: PKD domain-containing protein, partial [Chitinophagaceae bacterium]